MTTCGRFPTQFALSAMLTIVLLAAPVSSSAAVPVTHFQANGTFSDVFFSCNASGVCASISVFLGGSSSAPQTFLSYGLFLPSGEFFFGFGTIPNANVTASDSKTLTLATTDTSTIDPSLFTNTFCDVNGNCTDSPNFGGPVSGSWKQIKFVSTHSTFSNITHLGHQAGTAQFISNGASDSCRRPASR